MATREPFPTNPEDFDDDDRISYSKTSDGYVLEDHDGSEWEWLTKANKWVPVLNEDDVEKQRQAYAVKGVDETVPAGPLKRKKQTGDDDDDIFNFTAGEAPAPKKKQKPEQERQNTAIYVTGLPEDVEVDDVYAVFVKFGVIAESIDSNEPRIKLYYDDEDEFKGDALIIYHRPESVDLAITMLDKTDFRTGQAGPMRVTVADTSYKSQKDQPLKSDEAKKKGTNANRDRQKAIEKKQKLNDRLADWSDEDDNPSAMTGTSNRYDKIVTLKGMFTLEELAEDAKAAMEIKEDVREESEKHGPVTNVVLYDKEEDGVMTVRFENAVAARACVDAFDGRVFDGRRVVAYVATQKERFKKSKKGEVDEAEEAARLEKFSKDIEKE